MIIKGSDGSTEWEFSNREGLRRRDGSESFIITIRELGLKASQSVYAWDPRGESLPDFFTELAKNWRGWEGKRKWNSFEGEFELVCSHDRIVHIAIEMTLKSPGSWTVQSSLNAVAGELDNIAKEITIFFDVEHSPKPIVG